MKASPHCVLTIAGGALLIDSLAAPVRADNLYVSSQGFNAVERFPSDYVYPHPFFIGGPTAPGALDYPLGLAFDSAGILYVADSNSIERYSQTGAYLGVLDRKSVV